MSEGELILYAGADGGAPIQLRAQGTTAFDVAAKALRIAAEESDELYKLPDIASSEQEQTDLRGIIGNKDKAR